METNNEFEKQEKHEEMVFGGTGQMQEQDLDAVDDVELELELEDGLEQVLEEALEEEEHGEEIEGKESRQISDIEQSEDTSEELEEIDFSIFNAAKSKAGTSIAGEPGLLTVVNSLKNGQRVMCSDEVMKKLKYPNTIQFSFTDNEIAIAEELPGEQNTFTVKKSGKKGIIYSVELVKEITQLFNLDFSNRVSITFYKGTYGKIGNFPVAIIKVK